MLPDDLFRHMRGVGRAIEVPSDRALFMTALDNTDASAEQRAELVSAVDNPSSGRPD